MHMPRRAHVPARALFLVAWLAIASLLAPSATLADTDLVLGGEAVVAYAQGDDVRVRDGASYDAGIVTSVPEGSTVSVLDGPFDDGVGNLWYAVSVAGVSGYMVSDYLANATSSPAATPSGASVTDSVNLRTGPSVGYASVTTIPAGSGISMLGESTDGWYLIDWSGYVGWIYGEFISDGGSAPAPAPEPEPEPEPEPDITWIEAGLRYTNDSVNFRSAATLDSTVYELLPAGLEVELTGRSQNGFAEAVANGYTGWISLDFLTASAPAESEPDVEWIEAGTRYTNDSVNFRSGPSLDSTVYDVLSPGTAVELSGRSQNGFAEGEANGSTGWVSIDYLSLEAPAAPSQPSAPSAGGSSIIFPMSGGEWYIGQGYNGSSHQNNSGLWQYQYSFDFARTDENTGGQATYSPVNGTVRWLDPSTGGISIDAGGGLAVALFHIDIDPSVQPGDSMAQGQYIGTVSYPGGGGNGGWPHIHMSAWATNDGGNWDRRAIPFEGAFAISGMSFPSNGVAQDWTGTVIYP